MSKLDDLITVSEDDIQSFREKGAIKLKNILSPETLKEYKGVISAEVEKRYDRARAFENSPELYARAFQQISNLWVKNEKIKEFVFSKRLASIATQLMGTNGVRMYHDQALFKEAGGGITPWHCDQVYWPLSNENTITAWIPLQATSLEMGPLSFAEGSHKRKIGRDLVISEESEKTISKNIKEMPYMNGPFDLGEVSFHYGYTMHNAGPNNTDEHRMVMTIIYMDSEMRVLEPKSESHKSDLASWMPGLKPGDLCNSELNPLIYSAV
jgi:ectoine hydroxylase-related dioxygenase (phytanoyl-CoA dioxygenase family)